MKTLITPLMLFLSFTCLPHSAHARNQVSVNSGDIITNLITEIEVIEAQDSWCAELLGISQSPTRQVALSKTRDLLNKFYAFDRPVNSGLAPVLFKPTLTVAPHTVRTTFDGALSYFIGGDTNFPNDSGFAVKGWNKCTHQDTRIAISGNHAYSMAKVIFEGTAEPVVVDKSWGFFKDQQGNLRVILHHSSLEHTGE